MNAKKKLPNECIDCIQDNLSTETFNWLLRVPMTTPKLVSMPVHPDNVKKVPKHTNQAEYESFLMINIILSDTHSTITYVQLSKTANHKAIMP